MPKDRRLTYSRQKAFFRVCDELHVTRLLFARGIAQPIRNASQADVMLRHQWCFVTIVEELHGNTLTMFYVFCSSKMH